jgi:hypothetical protein
MPGCSICGPRLQGCYRRGCAATFGHAHLTLLGRDGAARETVAVCGAHTPSATASHHHNPERPARTISDGPSRNVAVKRQRDRERRAAQRVVIDNHRQEFEDELRRIRGGAS